MAGHDFERPGAAAHPPSGEWPYHAPSLETPHEDRLHGAMHEDFVAVSMADEKPPMNGVRPWILVISAGVVGALLGGAVVGVMTWSEPDTSSVPITLDTFPREVMGATRNDLELREAGFGPTVERLDDEFEDQVTAFRFAYGGRGATLGYGRLVTLTIVDGIIAPGVPRTGEMDMGGRVRETRRLVSLDTRAVSCTFEPQPVQNADLGLDEFGTLSSTGRTECILNDVERNLGLRIAHSTMVRGSGASEAAERFSQALKKLHVQLTE